MEITSLEVSLTMDNIEATWLVGELVDAYLAKIEVIEGSLLPMYRLEQFIRTLDRHLGGTEYIKKLDSRIYADEEK